MASYYGYVKRDADSYMNWGKVADTLSDSLTKEMEAREKKKTELDESARTIQNTINEIPIGKVGTINDNSMELAKVSTANIQSWNKELKQGKITPYEYMQRLQRTEDQVKLNYNIAKANSDVFNRVQERQAKNISNPVEGALFQRTLKQLSYQNTYPYQDVDGTIYQVAMKEEVDENGVARFVRWEGAPPKEALQSLNGMRAAMETTIDAFDYQKSSNTIAKMFGDQTVVKELRAATQNNRGVFVKTLDPRNRQTLPGELKQGVEAFEKAEESLIKSQLTPLNVTNMLMANIQDDNGQLYTITESAEEAAKDPNKILVEFRGTEVIPNFSTENGKKQYQKAYDLMQTAVRSQFKFEETRTETDQLDVPGAKRSSGGSSGGGGGALNPPGTTPKATPPTEGGVDIVAMRNDASRKISLRNINKNNPEQTAKALSPYFNSLGIKVEGQSSGGVAGVGKTHKIRLTLPNGTKTEWIIIDDANQSTVDALVGYVENADPALAAKAYPKK